MRTDLHLLHVALQLFAEKGYTATSMRDIASKAGVSPGLAYKYHPSKEALAMALYARIAEQFSARAPDLPNGTIAERFAAAMAIKLTLITPHRSALRALASRALDPTDRLGVLGPRTSAVRARNSGVFALVVQGASDCPPKAETARLGRLLYGAHLAIILAWTQDEDTENRRANGVISMACKAIGLYPMLGMFGGADQLDAVDTLFGDALVSPLGADQATVVDTILKHIFLRRRLISGAAWPATDAALALHRPPVVAAMALGEPIELVLPAFPAKSPNPAKTLGPLPDLAEVLALRSLQLLCDEIAQVYAPGATLTIASDGHVFADLVEVPDADVNAYQSAIAAIIQEESLSSLSLFDLRDVYSETDGDESRTRLVARYAQSIDALKARAVAHPRHQIMADGIHRFLFEDAVVLHPEQSRSANRRATKSRAWEVIRRSDAWGALVAEAFPNALRLSIHPQPEVSEKIGIHLMQTEDAWLTPWHGVAVLGAEGARLMKRYQAEELGATAADDHLLLP
jgi:pyoverdine/dityrosine biosynthesis protein Dit1